ncbi:FAD-binding protein [Deltaproteobacteria bacterium]|nr:FAD-binding protein [Deltaproteobacteria bacterium]
MNADEKDTMKLSRREFGKLATLGATGMITSGVLTGSNPEKVSAKEVKTSDESAGKTSNWMTKPDPIDKRLIAEKFKADVVIIGGGNAGTPAARAAAECGASVIVIEKQDEKHFSFFWQ